MRPALWLGIATACGVMAGVAWPPPPIPRAQQLDPPWVLPQEAGLAWYSSEDYQRTRQDIRWLGENAGGAASAEAGTWRLMGILTTPEPAALIMRQGDKKVARVEVGGALPDGSTVRAIQRDSITAEADGCRTTYRLYGLAPVAASGDCDADAEKTEPREKAT